MHNLIYAMEPLAYYFGMKPKEFWNSTYREINIYCQVNLSKVVDDFKRQIQLNEATTDKMIAINPMRKKPKLIKLREFFQDIFKTEDNEIKYSNQEMIKRLRSRM